jgi:hypothetical protein
MNVEIGTTETAQFFSGNICFEFSVMYLCTVACDYSRWLLSKGRKAEAEEQCRKIAK